MPYSKFIKAKQTGVPFISADKYLGSVITENYKEYSEKFPQIMGDDWNPVEDLILVREYARRNHINEKAATHVLDIVCGDVTEEEIDYDLVGCFFCEEYEHAFATHALKKVNEFAGGLRREIVECIVLKELYELNGTPMETLVNKVLRGRY